MSAHPAWLEGRRALIAGEGEALAEVACALRAAGAETLCSAAAGEEHAIAAELDRIEAEGPCDLLVHGGTMRKLELSEQIDLRAWRDSVSEDIDSRFLHSAEFARRCIASGRAGSILFLLPSPQPQAGGTANATIGGALDNLVKTLAVEWAHDGIRVNGIASRACEPGGLADDAARRSLGHLSAYILSDYGAYISGIVMGINEV